MNVSLFFALSVALVFGLIHFYFGYCKWRAKKRWERLYEMMSNHHKRMIDQGVDTSMLRSDMKEVANKIGKL